MKLSSIFLRLTGLFCLSYATVSCRTEPECCAPDTAQSKPLPSRTERIQNGVQWNTGEQNVRVQFYAEGTARVVKWVPGGTPDKSSLVVIQKDVPTLNVQVRENAESILLSSGKITVQLSKSDGAIQYLDARDRVLLKEQGKAILAPIRIEHEERAFSV